MTLKEENELNKDFYMLTQAQFTKLRKAFGGGPEIPFFQYTKTIQVDNADGTKTEIKESQHDFSPIKVKVNMMKRTKENPCDTITVLLSKNIYVSMFKSYMAQIVAEMGNKLDLFVVRPVLSDLPCIYEVKERKTLQELGIDEGTDVCLFDADISADGKPINSSQLYHIIGQQFNIAKEEYEQYLPKGGVADNTLGYYEPKSSMPGAVGGVVGNYTKTNDGYKTQNHFSSSRDDIPPEYAHDPALWEAIKASLGESGMQVPSGGARNDDFMDVGDDNYFGNDRDEIMGPGTPPSRRNKGPIWDESEIAPNNQQDENVEFEAGTGGVRVQ